MTLTIKALETNYAGCRFRSRLEARWAVFFDTLKIEWEYEKEGYEFSDGTRYLPDFWLPQVRMWAEIKPGAPTEEEVRKAQELANGTGRPVLFLDGMPRVTNFWAVHPLDERYPDFPDIMDYHISEAHQYWLTEGRFFCSTGATVDFPGHCEPEELGCGNNRELAAVEAARSARFGT